MKNLFTALLLILSGVSFSQNDFITEWEVTPDPFTQQTFIRFNKDAQGPVNYSWSEGSNSGSGTLSGGLSTETITLPGPGTYELILETTNLERFYMVANSTSTALFRVMQWGTASWTNMTNMFAGCENLSVTASDVPDLSNVTTMFSMFQNCSSLTSIPNIHMWNVSGVLDMSFMFAGAFSTSGNQANQGLGAWDVSNVQYMTSMFSGASVFNADLSNWNTPSVLDMTAMFHEALAFNRDIGNWNTANVQGMSQMFWNASSFNQDLNNWDVSNCLDMSSMFASAVDYNQPMSNWDVSSCMNMESMFSGASDFSQDLTSWNISAVQSLAYMFKDTDVNNDFGNWDMNASNADYMFENSGLTCENYSATLIGWTNGLTGIGSTNGVSFAGQTGMEYGINGAVARDYLVNTLNWSISGDAATGVECVQTASVDELSTQFLLYPIPAQDFLNISTESKVNNITIVSAEGKCVYSGKETSHIDISHLKDGIYLVQCALENNQVVTKKFIK